MWPRGSQLAWPGRDREDPGHVCHWARWVKGFFWKFGKVLEFWRMNISLILLEELEVKSSYLKHYFHRIFLHIRRWHWNFHQFQAKSGWSGIPLAEVESGGNFPRPNASKVHTTTHKYNQTSSRIEVALRSEINLDYLKWAFPSSTRLDLLLGTWGTFY